MTRREWWMGSVAAWQLRSQGAPPEAPLAIPVTKVGRLDRPKGASIYYEVTGSGPPIVFAHGLSGSHLSWWQQVPYFSGRYTCITFSHRGWGLSTDAPDGPHTTEFADDLAALVDHLKVAPVRLIAQSMGGWTCLAYALRHRDKVRGLVLAGTAGGLDPSRLAIDQDAAKASSEWRTQVAQRGIQGAAGERMAREQPALYFLYHQIHLSSTGLNRATVLEQLRSASTVDPRAVAALKIPLLILYGEEDNGWPTYVAAAKAVPGARVAAVAKAGHSVYFERPAEFNRIVNDFLQSVR